jgi:hypothetical protein
LIPHPPAAIPLSQQSRQRDRARTQPVSIANDGNAANATGAVRQHRPFLLALKAETSWAVIG